MKDEELLNLIAESPNQGYRILLELYQKPLYFYVRKTVLKHDLADDIMQNVWVKVFKNIQKFKRKSKLSTWLYRIATNEMYTVLKKEAHNQKMSFEEYSEKNAENLAQDSYFTGDEISNLLYQSVAMLPEKQRKVFQLKYFEEKKYEEIAEILDTSVGALKASYHHAVKKIKENLPKQMSI